MEDIYAVYNPNMVKAFINARKTLVNTTRPRKKHEETESREWVEKEFRKKCGKYEWNCGGMVSHTKREEEEKEGEEIERRKKEEENEKKGKGVKEKTDKTGRQHTGWRYWCKPRHSLATL